ncbi:hypothetical protein [Williamsia muralis]|uniref:hypothetical protein n=1 Tax=Williamsia marianensis TaxID=85044 RepID=UPI00382FEDDA
MTDVNSKVGRFYLYTAIGSVLAGVVAGCCFAMWTHTDDIKIAAGFSVFALIYILTQAIERVNELLINILDAVFSKVDKKDFAETTKRAALATVKTAKASAGQPVPADQEENLATARKELQILTAGTAFGLAFALIAGLDTGLLELTIKSPHIPMGLDWVISAAVISGGTAALHDLISKIQKSKEKDEVAS